MSETTAEYQARQALKADADRARLKADAAARGAPEYEPGRPVTTFETGARRDSDFDKLDFESFEHPLVIERFAVYMNRHRTMANGQTRDADDWQLGIPIWRYVKSLVRHVTEVRKWHRGLAVAAPFDIEEVLCAVIFNAHGLLFEILRRNLGQGFDPACFTDD